MKKQKKGYVGDLVKIPFREGIHTYGRILIEGSYAIYDYPSTVDVQDYLAILNSEILFVARVDIFAIKEGHWTVITNIPLQEDLNQFFPMYFNPAPMNDYNFNFYKTHKNEIEDAIKKDWIKTGRLQLDGMNGHLHIEERINDYYTGRINDYNKINIQFFKKYLGIPD